MTIKYDILVVGAGLYGAVIADQAAKSGKRVLVLEKRPHIGGMCYSYKDEESQILIHKYGVHVFHTKNRRIWDYIRQFADFNTQYRHRVKSQYKQRQYPFPINLKTINDFLGVTLQPEEVPAFLASKRGHYNPPRNLEEKIINMIGEELYEGFVKGYTTKQWGVNPSALPAEQKFRIPIRPNANEDYFDDPYQGIPRGGYTPVFEKMLRDVDVELNTDFLLDREYWQKKAKRLVYTGPLDRYFDFRYKALSWRGIHFAMETIKTNQINEVPVINVQDVDIPFSRIAELKHLHPETVPNTGTTILLKEMLDDPPSSEEAYSRDWILKPLGAHRDRQIFEKYRQLSKRERNVFFGGRIADYQYYDMDQVIGLALKASKAIVKSL